MLRLAVTLALLVAALIQAPASASAQNQCLAAPEQEALQLINAERAKVALPAYVLDARLAVAARLHSQDMAARGYFSHVTPDGVTFDQRIRAQGYPSPGGETIAAGYATPAAAIAGWMNSPGHKAILLHASLRHFGLGIGTGGPYGIYWTATFGQSSSAPVAVACGPGAPGQPSIVPGTVVAN